MNLAFGDTNEAMVENAFIDNERCQLITYYMGHFYKHWREARHICLILGIVSLEIRCIR